MALMSGWGESVEGFPVRVLNERAVRAAAGLLLLGAMVSFMNAMLLGNFQPTRWFVLMFVLDMAIRVFINPLYAPSMIVGSWVVRHQTPDWSGAPQKRFAWALGLVLGLCMAWLMVFHRVMGPINMLVCATCLTLMFFETAFGICLGCKMYNLLSRNKAQLCPGGVCEVPVVPRPLGWGKVAVLMGFVVYAVAAGQWIQATGPAPFDEEAMLDQMSQQLQAAKMGTDVPAGTSGSHTTMPAVSAPTDAERCRVPAFAKALGHEAMWKQHNQCPP
jgi:Domain of unknown function (DUF4395)